MYTKFQIKNFKCFRDTTIDSLGRVNLIAGKNGAGKTSLLEAIFLHAGNNPRLLFDLISFRGLRQIKHEFGAWSEFPLDFIFQDFNTSRPLEIAAYSEADGKRILSLKLLRDPEDFRGLVKTLNLEEIKGKNGVSTLELDKVLEFENDPPNRQGKFFIVFSNQGVTIQPPYMPTPAFQVYIILDSFSVNEKEISDRFSQLLTQKRKAELIEILQIIEPRLQELSNPTWGGVPVMHADVGLSKMIPLPLAGSGLLRLTNIVVSLLLHKGGVVLFDEIENGLHYSSLEKVWTAIGETARRDNIQVFATTHSFECIEAAHKVFSAEPKDDFRFYRLDKIENEVVAVDYDREALEASFNVNLEVR